MPLTGSASTLSAALRAALLANSDTQAQDNDALTAVCDEIASVVLAHIVANAVVTIPPGIPVSMVTPVPATGASTAPAVGGVS